MKPRHKRLAFIGVGLVGIGLATGLILNAFQGNLVFFFSPTEVVMEQAPVDRKFRLGGLVEEGSVERGDDGLTVSFAVTDTMESVRVVYTGILPDLFREGQGVVTQGRLNSDGMFMAEEVLARHDETYMAPEVAEAIERAKAAKAARDGTAEAAVLKNGEY